jgi:hypothetical protein
MSMPEFIASAKFINRLKKSIATNLEEDKYCLNKIWEQLELWRDDEEYGIQKYVKKNKVKIREYIETINNLIEELTDNGKNQRGS